MSYLENVVNEPLVQMLAAIAIATISKVLASAIAGRLKAASDSAMAKDISSAWQSHPGIPALVDAIGLSVVVFIAAFAFSGSAPALKSDLLTLFALTLGAIFFAGSLIFDSIQLSLKKFMRRSS